MHATPTVATYRLTIILALLDEELAPLALDPGRRDRIGFLVHLARREAAELTGAAPVALRAARPAAATASTDNVLAFPSPAARYAGLGRSK